jgi:hypothetical protein
MAGIHPKKFYSVILLGSGSFDWPTRTGKTTSELWFCLMSCASQSPNFSKSMFLLFGSDQYMITFVQSVG